MVVNNFLTALADGVFGSLNVVEVSALVPEALVLLSAVVFLLGGVFANDTKTDRIFLGLGVFVLISLFAIMAVFPSPLSRQEFFSRMFVADVFSQGIKLLLVASTALALILSDSWLSRGGNMRFEYIVLTLFSLLGMMLMVSANDLLALYVGLELSSLPLYVLASFSRDTLKSTESGLKYFTLGALASGILLFGMSLVYGFAGSTGFGALHHLFAGHAHVSKGVLLGVVLIITGMCFKVSAAPFHMWTPDVYEGAPTPVTAFFSVAPKIAALALFIRLLMQPFYSMRHDWQLIIMFVAALSMLTGALGALMQGNIKRLLAYSAIGHAGYALVGLAAGSPDGVAAVIIYFALYIPMSIGSFACILMMNKGGEAKERIDDLAGLSRSNPGMAFALAVFMFSMAGIPPLAGFFGKLYVFLAAVHAGLYPLAVLGVLASVIACYYYLKVVKIMYFDDVSEPFDKNDSRALELVMYVCAGVILLFCINPAPLVSFAHMAAEALFQ